MNISRLLLVGALCAATLMVRAEPLIALDNANPPFMYLENGETKGLYAELLRAAFQRAGVTVEIHGMPWKRALRMGENGRAGIGGIYQTAPRLEIFDYSQPIFEEKLIVYARTGSSLRFTRVEDLYGMRVGVIRGWSYTEAFDTAVKAGHIEVSESSSDEANFRMLTSGRLDAVIAIELAGQRILKRLQLTKVRALEPALSINPTYLVFAKKAQQRPLLQRFDQSLAQMRDDGSLEALVQRVVGSQ